MTSTGGRQDEGEDQTRPLLLHDVEVDGRRVDVAVIGGRVVALGEGLPGEPEHRVIDGGGGALLPGLHDHHLHLLATAAASRSTPAGPPGVTTPAQLADTLRRAARACPPDGWVRAVGYHTSVAGDLDRDLLDDWVTDRPVRVQDRSGIRWTLNSRACEAVGLDRDPPADVPAGVERGADGRPTGRLTRSDRWLRQRLPAGERPDLADLGRRLVDLGVAGVTDATPVEDPADLQVLADAGLPVRVQVTGGPALAGTAVPDGVERGPVKVVVDDHDLPALNELTGWITVAHSAGRPVAIHCVSRVALILALAAWEEAGTVEGDRVEHGSVVPTELLPTLAAARLTVVTQPAFVAERGDRYVADVDPDDVAHLYRCGSLLDAGIRVGGSTDAPYGPLDPWRAIAAAVDRRTPSGRVLGAGERVEARRALDLFLAPLTDPGGAPRRVRAGAPADLVLLDRPLAEALRAPCADHVRATVTAGMLHER